MTRDSCLSRPYMHIVLPTYRAKILNIQNLLTLNNQKLQSNKTKKLLFIIKLETQNWNYNLYVTISFAKSPQEPMVSHQISVFQQAPLHHL